MLNSPPGFAISFLPSCTLVIRLAWDGIPGFSLFFSIRAETWGLARTGLDMTIVAVGACMVIATSAQTNWKGPRVMRPLLKLGQRSYEVYLSHMFIVFGLFQLFILDGKTLLVLSPYCLSPSL